MKDEYKLVICVIVGMVLTIATVQIFSINALLAFFVGVSYGLIAMVVNEKWCEN